MEVKRQYKGLTSYQVRRINREWVVVSSSWNDLPRGVLHTTERNSRPLKHLYTLHAEQGVFN